MSETLSFALRVASRLRHCHLP